MEGLELDISALIFEHLHHHLQVVSITDILGHNVEVMSVQ